MRPDFGPYHDDPTITSTCDTCGAGLPERTCCGEHPDVGTTPIAIAPRFVWVVTIEISSALVADGADLSDRRQLERMIERAYPCAYGSEVRASVVLSPDRELVARTMGYANSSVRDKR